MSAATVITNFRLVLKNFFYFFVSQPYFFTEQKLLPKMKQFFPHKIEEANIYFSTSPCNVPIRMKLARDFTASDFSKGVSQSGFLEHIRDANSFFLIFLYHFLQKWE